MKKSFFVDLFLFTIFYIFSGIFNIFSGFSVTHNIADIRNYHIYNPWAFLNNRYLTDIMPAGIQSYFNPLLDIPHFLLVKYFNNHPPFVAFIEGFSVALLMFIIYKFSVYIFKNYHSKLITIFSLFTIITSPIILKFWGDGLNDIFVGDLILIAVFFIIKNINKYCPYIIMFAGILLGLATGLKLTVFTATIGITVSFLIFYKQFKEPQKLFVILIMSELTGFLISNGFWMYKLFILYGNPLMPYFNGIFHSDLIGPSDICSLDFDRVKPKNLYTFIFQNQLMPTLSFINIVLFFHLFSLKFFENDNFKKQYPVNNVAIDFMLVSYVFSYILWLNIFATYRYLIPYIALSGIFIAYFTMKICYLMIFLYNLLKSSIHNKFTLSSRRFFLSGLFPAVLIIICGLVILPCFRIPDMYKLTDKVIDAERFNIPDDAIVFVDRGTGILIPYQNPKASYIHIPEFLFTYINDEFYTESFYRKFNQKLEDYPLNNIYFILTMPLPTDKELNSAVIQLLRTRPYKVALSFYPYREQVLLHEIKKFNINIDTKTVICLPKNNSIFHYYFCTAEIK